MAKHTWPSQEKGRDLSAFIEIESDAVLVGVDGAIEATQVIIGSDMDATVAQNPYAIGKVGVQQATRAANGKSHDKGGATLLPARVKE
jgi:ABC-type sugar transport system substrate-binding protein